MNATALISLKESYLQKILFWEGDQSQPRPGQLIEGLRMTFEGITMGTHRPCEGIHTLHEA